MRAEHGLEVVSLV